MDIRTLKGAKQDMWRRMYAKWLQMYDHVLYMIEGDEI